MHSLLKTVFDPFIVVEMTVISVCWCDYQNKMTNPCYQKMDRDNNKTKKCERQQIKTKHSDLLFLVFV